MTKNNLENPESSKLFTVDQAFWLSYDLAPSPPPSPSPVRRVVRKTEKERQLADRIGGRSQIIRWRGSLVLYKSLNIFWVNPSRCYSPPPPQYLDKTHFFLPSLQESREDDTRRRMGKLPHGVSTGNQYSHTEWTNSNLGTNLSLHRIAYIRRKFTNTVLARNLTIDHQTNYIQILDHFGGDR
jgi:hypothetical protein